MTFPDGYEVYLQSKGHVQESGKPFIAAEFCVLLCQALYGLVQAARQW